MIIPICLIIASFLGVFVSYLLWRKYGDDEPIVKVKCSTPPRNYNSAELGFFEKGQSIPEDIMTLLIGLANKGYLKIQENFDTTLFVKERNFKIIKLKEYDGNNEYEKIFFEGLFRYNTEVSEIELDKRFYLTLQKIENKLESKHNTKLIFEESGAAKGKIVLLIGIIVLIATLIIPVYVLYGLSKIKFAFVFIICEAIGFAALKTIPQYDLNKKSNIVFVFLMVFIFLFFMITPVKNVTNLLKVNYIYNIVYFIGLISFAIILFITHYMPKRTKFGTEILGEIEGFKDYLESADKKDIEEQIKKEPMYFYQMLPYTYVLDTTYKWIKVFEEIGITKPDWYDSENEFKFEYLNNFIEKTMSLAVTREPYFKKLNIEKEIDKNEN